MQTRTGHFCNTVKTTNLQKQQRLDRGLHLFWAKKNKAVSATATKLLHLQPNTTPKRCEIYDSRRGGKSQGGNMKPELEALYEGLCRQEPDLFEPEALHKQLDTLAPETLDALLQLCEDWQKHAFAVGFTAAVRLLTK
jgi:hypothetical protein